MKVGIISKGSPDYLIDLVTDGLFRLLGRSNVASHYSTRFEPGTNPAYRYLYECMAQPDSFNIHDADVLVASGRSVDLAAMWRVKTGKAKIAIVDGEDSILLNNVGVELSTAYFKREYLLGTQYDQKVLPLPLAAFPEEMPPETKRSGVFYSGEVTHHFRKEIHAVLIGMGIPPAPHQSKTDYNRSLIAAEIGVAVRGCGWDTYRYWEVPYFGAALLAQRTGHVIPGNFRHCEEAVFYDENVTEFYDKLTWMLKHPEETAKIAAAGQKAVTERHLSIHRAKTVLESVA